MRIAEVGGITVIDGKGSDAGRREKASGSRDTIRFTPEFHSRTSLVTVVDDSKLDKVINAIIGAASTGSPGDGKIFMSSVVDVIDIGSNKRGNGAI